jgi:hypothetical protein
MDCVRRIPYIPVLVEQLDPPVTRFATDIFRSRFALDGLANRNNFPSVIFLPGSHVFFQNAQLAFDL